MKKKHWIIILIVSLIIIVPSVAFGLERVVDFYKPKPSEYYETNNPQITLKDLVYTGSHVGVIKGAKTGTIPMGSTPLLRSAENSSSGYAFYKPSELKSLATSLNGNPDYVFNHPDTFTEIKKTADGSGRETWVWARDLGRAAGATVDIEETGEKDESGLPRLRVIFNTSKYPLAAFTNNEGKTPTNVKAGERFYAFVAAEEFDPYQAQISWELTMNGRVIDSASGSANRSVRNVPITVSETGTYTLALSVTDGIERKTVLTHTVTATKDAPPPGEPDPGPEPEPEPEPDENLPPVVRISGPTTVMAGEQFCLRADASDPDGTVEDYQWDYTGNGILTGSIGCFLWYDYEGNQESLKDVYVTVTDDKGATASAFHQIKVLPPVPHASFKMFGWFKENRRIDGQSTSSSSPLYPIDWSKSYFEISAIDDDNTQYIRVLLNNDVEKHGLSKFFNELSFQSLYKKHGKYKVKLYVENTIGLSDIAEGIFQVAEDLPPVAEYTTLSTVYREKDLPKSENKYAEIEITNKSYSPDGDEIAASIFEIRFDTKNNGEFEGTAVKFDSLKMIPNQRYKFDYPGIDLPFYATMDEDMNLVILSPAVGEYIVELEVFEEFGKGGYSEKSFN